MLIEPESGRRPLLFDPNLTLGDPGFKLMGSHQLRRFNSQFNTRNAKLSTGNLPK